MTKAVRQSEKSMQHWAELTDFRFSSSAYAHDKDALKYSMWRPDEKIVAANRTLVLEGTYTEAFEATDAIWIGNPVQIIVYEIQKEIKTFTEIFRHSQEDLLTGFLGIMSKMSLKEGEKHHGYCFVPPESLESMQHLVLSGYAKYFTYVGTKWNRSLHMQFLQVTTHLEDE